MNSFYFSHAFSLPRGMIFDAKASDAPLEIPKMLKTMRLTDGLGPDSKCAGYVRMGRRLLRTFNASQLPASALNEAFVPPGHNGESVQTENCPHTGFFAKRARAGP